MICPDKVATMPYNFKLGPEAKAKIFLSEEHCPVCGKIFFPTPNIWAYKVGGVNVCSYGCVRKGEKK